jgi:hypothetical protein
LHALDTASSRRVISSTMTIRAALIIPSALLTPAVTGADDEE